MNLHALTAVALALAASLGWVGAATAQSGSGTSALPAPVDPWVTNPNTGASATTDVARGADSQGAGAARQTTYTNPTTGQTTTSTSAVGREGNDLHADHDGNVYKNTGRSVRRRGLGRPLRRGPLRGISPLAVLR